MPAEEASLARDRSIVDAVYDDLGLACPPAEQAPRIIDVEPNREAVGIDAADAESRFWRA